MWKVVFKPGFRRQMAVALCAATVGVAGGGWGQTESPIAQPDFDPAPSNVTVCEGEVAVFEAYTHYLESANILFNWLINGRGYITFSGVSQGYRIENRGNGEVRIGQLHIPYSADLNNSVIQRTISFINNEQPTIVSPSAKLVYLPDSRGYITDVTTELCGDSICLSWPEPEAADGKLIYEKNYTLEINKQNPDGLFSEVEQRNLDTNHTRTSVRCQPLQFIVMIRYCSPSESITHISNEPKPVVFLPSYTDPVTGLDIRQAAYLDQVQVVQSNENITINWVPLENEVSDVYHIQVEDLDEDNTLVDRNQTTTSLSFPALAQRHNHTLSYSVASTVCARDLPQGVVQKPDIRFRQGVEDSRFVFMPQDVKACPSQDALITFAHENIYNWLLLFNQQRIEHFWQTPRSLTENRFICYDKP